MASHLQIEGTTESRYEMQIECNFEVGQTVWCANSREKVVDDTCSKCGGTGQLDVLHKGAELRVRCPYCLGLGAVTKRYEPDWYVTEGKILAIKIVIESKTHIKISTELGEWISQKNVFATEEEAKKKCDEENSKKQG